jgi:hypothetical protein
MITTSSCLLWHRSSLKAQTTRRLCTPAIDFSTMLAEFGHWT